MYAIVLYYLKDLLLYKIFTVFKSYVQVALLVLSDNCIRGVVEFGHVVKWLLSCGDVVVGELEQVVH